MKHYLLICPNCCSIEIVEKWHEVTLSKSDIASLRCKFCSYPLPISYSIKDEPDNSDVLLRFTIEYDEEKEWFYYPRYSEDLDEDSIEPIIFLFEHVLNAYKISLKDTQEIYETISVIKRKLDNLIYFVSELCNLRFERDKLFMLDYFVTYMIGYPAEIAAKYVKECLPIFIRVMNTCYTLAKFRDSSPYLTNNEVIVENVSN
ncbi:MAG: hypothetical protein DSY42_05145, partial [Aquifex sp.]